MLSLFGNLIALHVTVSDLEKSELGSDINGLGEPVRKPVNKRVYRLFSISEKVKNSRKFRRTAVNRKQKQPSDCKP